MSSIIDWTKALLYRFESIIGEFTTISAVLDVLLVALLIYGLILQLRRTQSIQIIKGIFLIAVIYFVVSTLEMRTSQFIFSQLFSNILIIIIVLFNNEIRQALEHIGQSRFKKISFFTNTSEEVVMNAINATCRACDAMSNDKIGSLIIFQRKTLLGDLTKGGVPIDSMTTTEMLFSIFFPKAALHDGAIVIHEGRIMAARCIVPLKNDREVLENVGTRHRAALEITRSSDAVAVVTSEETGIISIAIEGELIRGITDSELRDRLISLLISRDENEKTTFTGRLSKLFRKNNK
ncbi:MAG: diadenylate cyclase CdaA [Oscillospiraceae bacterium]|jgi:diadenylate cyclase|nr:diadenylate cyclase CdaA [Oscillospiraceae bacterium]